MSGGFVYIDVDLAAVEYRAALEQRIASARKNPAADPRVMDLNARAVAVSEAVFRFVANAQNAEEPWSNLMAVLPSALINGLCLDRSDALQIVAAMQDILVRTPNPARLEGEHTFSDAAMRRGGRA